MLSSNSYHWKYVWFISQLTHVDSQYFRKILAILINDSSDSNHLSKFTVLVVVAYTPKEKRHISKKGENNKQSKHTTF